MPPVSAVGKFDFLDVGGSLNDGQPGTAIAVNEWQQLWNFYQFGTKLVRRGGMERETGVNEAPATENLTGLHVLNLVDGSRYMLAGGLTRLWRQEDDALVELPRLEGGFFNSTDLLWVTVQRNDIAYWMRRDNGGLRRSSFDYVQNAGILAPITAPTLTEDGAGDLTAGDYLGVVTFYNSVTGMESNPSPASAVLTLGASKKIDWSAIPTSSNPQVNARRLYRTVPNQTGRYFFVAQINDNSTTTYVGDNVVIQDLGVAASFRNGMPPGQLEAGDFWKERLFATDGIDAFYSEAGMPEAFDGSSVIPVFRNDGHRISAVHAFGDRLMLGKTNKVHYLLGTDPSDFSLHTLSDKHGCWSHHSMKSAEGNLFWYGGDNIYRSDGASVYSISTIKVKNILATIPAADRDKVVGAVWPLQSWYMLALPTTAVSPPVPGSDEVEAVQRVVNPGLETGDLTGWTTEGPCAAVTSPTAPEGVYSGELSGTEEDQSDYLQIITPEVGEEAVVSIYLRGTSTGFIQAYAYTDNNFYLQPDGTWVENGEPWANQDGTSFVLHTVEADPVPAGATNVTLEVACDNTGTMYFDSYTWTIGEEAEEVVTPNRTVLIYNYKTDVWTQFSYQPETSPAPPNSLAPAFILSDFNEDDEPTLYATFYDGRIWRLEAGLTDDGHEFNIFAVSKDHDFGAVGLVKFLYRLYILSTRLTSLVFVPTIGVVMDGWLGGAGGPTKTRSVRLDVARPWKRINLSSLGKPAYTLAFFFNYTGKEHVEISGYSMEVLVQPRAIQPL